MNYKLPELGNQSITKKLFLGVMILGIGFLCWALIGIGAPYYYNQQAAKNNYAPSATDSSIIDTVQSMYPNYPVEGETIGKLTIPVLNKVFPIIQGTSDADLKNGAGHYLQSVLPGENDNCVISAHRETFFSRLGEVKIGDNIIAETSAGIFTYKITDVRIVDKDDKTVIVPTEVATLTLTTCYPLNYVGNAPSRYIVTSIMID